VKGRRWTDEFVALWSLKARGVQVLGERATPMPCNRRGPELIASFASAALTT
jgi:hypothetical protein